MHKFSLLPLTLLFVLATYFTSTANTTPSEPKPETESFEVTLDSCYAQQYHDFQLTEKLCYDAFEKAMTGYLKINPDKEILTIIDYSKASLEERLFVLDLKNNQLLFSSVVAHGQGSGDNYATKFSNRPGSHQSSLGFFKTLGTYRGGNGYSLRLEGLEEEINDKALPRAIVMHGADYADPERLKGAKRLGRSWGCPALPHKTNKEVIDTIKEGSVLFIYAEDSEYLEKSNYI